MINVEYSIIAAYMIDLLIGDPRTNLHPVVLMGNLISFLEKRLNRAGDSQNLKLIKGGVLVIIVVAVTYAVAEGILILISRLNISSAEIFIEALVLSFMIAPKSLSEAGREIFNLLTAGDINEARRKTSWIVGRDTENLDESEISRATIETVAENTVDGVISPLFFYVIGGLPLAMVYRAVNTMDSMIGYKNEKFLYFGRIAAKLDDVMNYVPARLTALLFIISAIILKLNYKGALEMMKRDAAKHPSPNGGYAEATVAGALNIRLGGFNSYFGRVTFREYMGDAIEQLNSQHIMLTIKMMYTASILFLILVGLINTLKEV